mgnify:CR=1 FL=1
MEILRNNKRAEQFWDKIRAAFSKPRDLAVDEVHVSELLAPRKAYWVRTLGERVTDEMVGFFATGQAFHLMLQNVVGVEFSEQQVRIAGIVGTQDIVPPDGETTEFKTSRKWTVPDEPPPQYIDQISSYLAMADKEIGHILVVFFTANRRWDGTKPSSMEWVSWEVRMTKAERSAQRLEMGRGKDALLLAVKTQQPKLVGLCPEWQCASIFKGEVQSVCPFYEECQPEGRYPLAVLTGPQKTAEATKTKIKRTMAVAKLGVGGEQTKPVARRTQGARSRLLR